jgi:hypothetical protein
VGQKTTDQPHDLDKTDRKRHSSLGLIVTTNGFQVVGMFIVQPQSQAPKVLKHFILVVQEENPRVTRIVSIWSNCQGCSVITMLTGEWEAMIILA